MTPYHRIENNAREYIPERRIKSASQIQAEIELLRADYATRRSLNQPRRDRMMGAALLTLLVLVPALCAILIRIIQ